MPWWRVLLTIVIVLVGGVVSFWAMAAVLSDPGPEGVTAEFERSKTLGALMFVLVPLVTVGLLVLLHRSIVFGSRRRRAP